MHILLLKKIYKNEEQTTKIPEKHVVMLIIIIEHVCNIHIYNVAAKKHTLSHKKK